LVNLSRKAYILQYIPETHMANTFNSDIKNRSKFKNNKAFKAALPPPFPILLTYAVT